MNSQVIRTLLGQHICTLSRVMIEDTFYEVSFSKLFYEHLLKDTN